MRFSPTKLPGAVLIHLDKHADSRGYFARFFCESEFREAGLFTRFVQANTAGSHLAGTLRGLHYQVPPHAEAKLIRCTRGAIFDVIIDLRPDSPTRGRWEGFRLDDSTGTMLYVPEGFAHGYQTLVDNTEVSYLVSHHYVPGAEAGIHFQDPGFRIDWPVPVTAISAKDQAWPPYSLATTAQGDTI